MLTTLVKLKGFSQIRLSDAAEMEQKAAPWVDSRPPLQDGSLIGATSSEGLEDDMVAATQQRQSLSILNTVYAGRIQSVIEVKRAARARLEASGDWQTEIEAQEEIRQRVNAPTADRD